MKFICFDSIDSTNTYLKNHYQELDDLTLVSAKNQTQGKGRNNRTWYSGNNNLLCSLLLKNKNYLKQYKAISIISAYSLIEVLKDYKIDELRIKWPNDVFYKDNKLCGILLEGVSKQELECLIVGIGVNVNQEVFNDHYLINPISLKNILNVDIDIDELKNKYYETLVSNLNKLVNGYDFYCEISKYDYLKGKDAYVLINNTKQLVNVVGINNDYSLKVSYDNKQIDMESGEVSFHI